MSAAVAQALSAGRVVGADPAGGPWRVAVGDDEVLAPRALSCLIAPGVGDRVLVARVGAETFILAVLDRLLSDSATVSVPGATLVTLSAPQLAVDGAESLALRSAGEVAVDGRKVNIRAGLFSLVGQMATFVADRLRSTARQREIVADQVVVQAGERTTLVRGSDVSEVGALVQTVETVSNTTAATAVLVAKDDVRFDAKRVTVG